MLPPSSSTSSSDEPESPPAAPPFSLRKLGRTTLFFCLFLALFEVAVCGIFTKTPLSRGSLHRFFWYGTSYETKLRELVNTPNLPANSILYAGWLGDGKMEKQPRDVDVTIYGMSFSAQLAEAMHELRPEQRQRALGGPGAPLSHTYAMYEADKALRKTRFAVVGVTSGGVQEVVLMNRGTLFADATFPYFFPRFKLVNGKIVRAADSLINSPDELRAALTDNPDLWRRQLDVLAANDPEYRRFYFASDPLDGSVLGRLVRRGLAKHHEMDHASKVLGPHGFRLDDEAPQLFRALLRQMVSELRAENVRPIVVLFSLEGQPDVLHDLVKDILRSEAIPYFDTNELCKAEDRANFLPDMHFNHPCNLAFARRTLQIMDDAERTGLR
jgi:hypothetical protein